VFTHVSTDELTKIDRTLEKMSIHTRTTHYIDENLLIVKFPTAEHEAAHLKFSSKVILNLGQMGIDDEFHPVGGTVTARTKRQGKPAL